jgi:hypothetical protein
MNIWVPKFKIVEPKSELLVAKPRICGHFTMEAVRPDGRRRKLADFDNLILDSGLNRIGTNSDWLNACQVGTGTNAATVNDTGLQTYLAGTTTLSVSSATTAQANAPYYTQNTRTYRFAAGVAAGNLSEVGVGWSSGSGSNLFSRARILDSSDNPTTITVLSDEFLDVTYRIRNYAPPSDTTGTVVINGVTHTYTVRAGQANSVVYSDTWGFTAAALRTGANVTAYSGTLGAITSSPTGTASSAPTTSALSYSQSSLYRDRTAEWGLSNANFGGGIGAFYVEFAGGKLQIGMSPNIMKTNSQTLSMTFRYSWARKS